MARAALPVACGLGALVLVVHGYRLGTMTGLIEIAVGALAAWLGIHLVLFRPTPRLADHMDRPRSSEVGAPTARHGHDDLLRPL